jgi:5-methylcytosine-specific restriction endonuclease McrA
MKRYTLARPRTAAYIRQGGRCFYCDLLMWTGNASTFAATYGLKVKQVRYLQCTGEHLTPLSSHGPNSSVNIAAACLRCNLFRHRRKAALPPNRYKDYVRALMAKGHWHSPKVVSGLERNS